MTWTMTLYVLRHAEPCWHGDDPGLSNLGDLQASTVAEHLRQAVPEDEPRVVMSSWYLRSYRTAEPIARALGLEAPVMVEWLRDWPGEVLHLVELLAPYRARVAVLCSHASAIDALLRLACAHGRRFRIRHTQIFVFELDLASIRLRLR
jgi:broad specificity phosphatase PhoE